MMYLLLILSLSIFPHGFSFASSTAAVEKIVEGQKFPAESSCEGVVFQRQGTGVRTASVFHVKVYAAGLYLEKEKVQAKAVDKTPSGPNQMIELYPLYEISKSDSEKGWKLALDEACGKNCSEIQGEQEKFLQAVPPFKKGDHQRYCWLDGKAQVFVGDRKVFQSSSRVFSDVLLQTWLGDHPVSDSLKKELLGK